MFKTAAIIGVLAIWSPAAAFAQWTVRPFAGVTFAAEHGFVDLDDAGTRVKPAFGAAAGREWSDAWLTEIEVATSPSFLKGNSGLIDSGRIHTMFANVSRRFGPATARFQPYVSAGAGVVRITLDDALDAFTSSSTLFAGNIGGGITAAARSRLRVAADLRYVRSRYTDPGAAALVETYVAYLRASAGVLLRF
jgi:hypothetical protein